MKAKLLHSATSRSGTISFMEKGCQHEAGGNIAGKIPIAHGSPDPDGAEHAVLVLAAATVPSSRHKSESPFEKSDVSISHRDAAARSSLGGEFLRHAGAP